MNATQYVVTSQVHGDHGGYADFRSAREVARRLNAKLFDAIVYFPLIEMEFSVSISHEIALNRQYRAEEYLVVQVNEE